MASPTRNPPPEKLAARVLRGIARCLVAHPLVVVVSFLMAAAASILATVGWLELQTDQNALVSTDKEYHQRYMKFLDEFGDQEFLHVVIEVDGKPERAAELADVIAAEVGALEEHVKATFHRIPAEAFGASVLLLPRYDEDKLAALVEGLQENRALLREFMRADRFSRLLEVLGELFRGEASARDSQVTEWGGRLVGLLLESMLAAVRGETPAPLDTQVETALREGSAPRDRGYLFTENGELAFVFIMPQKDYETLAVISEPLRRIRATLDAVRGRFPDMRFGLTGRPVLQADEMETTDRDMIRGTVVALVCVLVLFTLTFRRLRRPLLAGLALVVSICLTFGVVTVTIGYLTILSVVFAAMLVGLGIDFGIHLLARYQDELRERDDVDQAIIETLRTTGVGILAGGVTTAGAFYTAMLVHFQGLRELGFVAGSGVLICLATMLVFLPALIAASDHAVRRKRVLDPPRPIRVPGLGGVPRARVWILLGLGVPTVLGLRHFEGLRYNFNLIELQAEGLESVEYELLIMEKSDTSTWQAAWVAKSLSEVDTLIDGLRRLHRRGIVGQIESVRDFVPADQDARIATLAPAAALVEGLPSPAPTDAIDGERLTEALEGLLDRLDTAQSQLARELDEGDTEPAADRSALEVLEAWIRNVEDLLEGLSGQPESALARLGGYQVRWFTEIDALRSDLLALLRPAKLSPEALPALVRERFVSRKGNLVVYAYPVKDIWVESNMEEFVVATAKVRPDVTGTPLEVYESARLMREGFIQAALYSLIFVFVVLLTDFRNLRDTLLAMVPVVIGLVWLVQLMPLFRLDFNLANFFALPILIGCGVDGGIHVLHRFRESASMEEVGRTTASAVTLSFVTTIAGFGSLSIAHHRGVASLGSVMVLGCVTVLAATVLLLPALVESLITRDRAGKSRKVTKEVTNF